MFDENVGKVKTSNYIHCDFKVALKRTPTMPKILNLLQNQF